jgi:hypothetical protein
MALRKVSAFADHPSDRWRGTTLLTCQPNIEFSIQFFNHAISLWYTKPQNQSRFKGP